MCGSQWPNAPISIVTSSSPFILDRSKCADTFPCSLFLIYCLSRCECGNCEVMPTVDECVCCCKIKQVIHKKQEGDTQVTCITEHEVFEPVCLDTRVLQTAYFSYRCRGVTSIEAEEAVASSLFADLLNH